MNANLTKLISSAAAAFAMGGIAYAQQQQLPLCPPPFEQGYGLSQDKYPAAYNAPARLEVQTSWDLFLTGSFLYWYAAQDNMDLAFATTYTTAFLPGIDSKILTQKFEFKPAFKVGLGIDYNFDHWVSDLEYTWFRSNTTTDAMTVPGDSRGGTPVWGMNDWFYNFAGNQYASGFTSKWNLKIDLLDGTMSRPYYQSRKIVILPYGGMRMAWIRQNLHIKANLDLNYSTIPNAVVSHTHSNSWGIGPRAGFQGHWMLGWGFRLEGDVAGSLLYTRYTSVSHSEDDPTVANSIYYSAKMDEFSAVRPMADMSLGLGWGSYFDRQNYHFDLLATYDFNVMWGQNVLRQVVNSYVMGVTAQPGDLHLQGLTLTTRLDF
jgi:hypothetical protein